MKLFACGVTSPNPDDWNGWNGFDLVLAESTEQAAELSEKPIGLVFEVDMSKPCILLSQIGPFWMGEDL